MDIKSMYADTCITTRREREAPEGPGVVSPGRALNALPPRIGARVLLGHGRAQRTLPVVGRAPVERDGRRGSQDDLPHDLGPLRDPLRDSAEARADVNLRNRQTPFRS